MGFVPVAMKNVVGWQYRKGGITDDITLYFAKRRHIIYEVSNMDDDYAVVVSIENKERTFKSGDWIVFSSSSESANLIALDYRYDWEPK